MAKHRQFQSPTPTHRFDLTVANYVLVCDLKARMLWLPVSGSTCTPSVSGGTAPGPDMEAAIAQDNLAKGNWQTILRTRRGRRAAEAAATLLPAYIRSMLWCGEFDCTDDEENGRIGFSLDDLGRF